MKKHLLLLSLALILSLIFHTYKPTQVYSQVCYGSHTYVDYGCDYNNLTRRYSCVTQGSDVQSCGSSCSTFGMVFCQGGTSCTRSSYGTSCSVYYPPPPPQPPPPPPNTPTDPNDTTPPPSTPGPVYICVGESCQPSETGSGWADPNCGGFCALPVTGGETEVYIPEVTCTHEQGPNKQTWIVNKRFFNPGETITWSTHQAGGGSGATRAQRLNSTSPGEFNFTPAEWSSYTCPGDSICLVAHMRGYGHHVMGMEVQLKDEQRYCFDNTNDVYTNPCSKDSHCSGGQECRDRAKKHFYAGPRNATYMLTSDEHQAFLRKSWSPILNGGAMWNTTDITFLEKNIPFGAHMLPWINCASMIGPHTGSCFARSAGNPSTGNYFGMEQDIFLIQEEPNFWCAGGSSTCRHYSDWILREEVKNPLAQGLWFREIIMQIPLSELTPGINSFNIRSINKGGADTFNRALKCDVASFTYNYDPSTFEMLQSQASCSGLQLGVGDSPDTIPQFGRGKTVELSGSFSPSMEFYPIDPSQLTQQFTLDASQWTKHGSPTPPAVSTQFCTDAGCGDQLNQPFLQLQPAASSTGQYIASKFIDLYMRPDGQRFGVSFAARPSGYLYTPLTNVALDRFPNYYREAQGRFDQVDGGRYIAQPQNSVGKFLHFDGTSSTTAYLPTNEWSNHQLVFDFPKNTRPTGPDDWVRDMIKSSTKVRLTLPLGGMNGNMATDYANIAVTSDPTPEYVHVWLKKFPDNFPVGVSESLKNPDGTWTADGTITTHFHSTANWMRIGVWDPNLSNPTGWSPQPVVGSSHRASWTVPSTLATGKYLLVTNIHNGLSPADQTTKVACTGNPYGNFTDASDLIARPIFANCSENCARVIEILECPTVAEPPVVSRWDDITRTELSKISTAPTETSTTGTSLVGNYIAYDLTAAVPASSDKGDKTQVEALIYKRGSIDSSSLPGTTAAVNSADFPGAAYIGPVSTLTKDSYLKDYRKLTLHLQETQGPWITIAARTVQTTCEPLRSSWVLYHVNLRTSVTGRVVENTAADGSCSTFSTLSPTVIQSLTLTHKQFASLTPITRTLTDFTRHDLSFTIFHLSGPFTHPWFWSTDTNLRSFKLKPAPIADSEEGYACATINPEDNDGRCQFPETNGGYNAPRWFNNSQDFTFCLVKGVLMHNSWWQTRGGLAFSKGNATLKPPIKPAAPPAPPARSSKCDPDVCQPFVMARRLDLGTDINPHTSAGFLISNHELSPVSPYSGYLTQQPNSGAMAKQTASPTVNPIGIQPTQNENYDSFWNKFVQAQMTTLAAGSTTSSDVIQALNGNQYGTDPSGASLSVVYLDRDAFSLNLTANPGGEGAAGIHIPANRRVILFVRGNLTITGAVNLANQITVDPSSFLLIAAKGDITFSSDLGHDIHTQMSPIVNGIFYSDKEIIIQSKGGLTPSDRKFVGAGSFIGKTGVQLNRKFDSSDILSKEKNAASPVEMFIHRPDLVLNTPEILKSSTTTWQEVN